MYISNSTKAILSAIIAITILPAILYIIPQYNVYTQRLQGEAELQRAESNRRIAIEEAKANKIIGDSLKHNEGYLRYLYIQSLSEAETKGNKVIYIPTEAGLPILESGRGLR